MTKQRKTARGKPTPGLVARIIGVPPRKTRIAGLVAVIVGVLFGLMGGEYSTVDWWTLRREIAAQERAIERLTAERDSLEREATAIETDPATQERVAREEFGMLRDGETLYRIEREPR